MASAGPPCEHSKSDVQMQTQDDERSMPTTTDGDVATATAGLRVLIADDDEITRELLTDQLTGLGHQVVAAAATGREAVQLASTHLPDVIVLDVHMPDGSGLEAAEEIAGALPAVAIILLSGDESLTLSDRDVTATSALSFLPKPTPPRMLDATVRLGSARARALRSAKAEASDALRRLTERKLIERAKGLLMRRTGLSEQEAYRILQRTSQDRSTPMAEIARTVIDGEPLHRSAAHHSSASPAVGAPKLAP
jgi:two-component system, response regulator PdtaR